MEQSITFSDLTMIAVDGIIIEIHKRIKYDVYICDLRLVNRQFNEAILHFLAFTRDPRPYTPSHYRSCRRNCPRWREDSLRTKCALLECRDHGICNPTYATIHLLAGIRSQRDLKPPFSEFYHTLREAVTRLRTDVARFNANFSVLRSKLSEAGRFSLVSQNPVFNDKISIALCKATLLVLDLNSKGRYRPPWDKDFIRQRRVCFWLENLACYLGDIEMLQFYISEESDDETSDEKRAKENQELLGTASAQGHETIFQFLLPPRELRQHDIYLALRGACYSGSASMTEMILGKICHDDLDSVCSQPLSGWRNSIRLSPNYPAVAAIIDSHYARQSQRVSPRISQESESSHARPAGRNLIQQSQGSTTVLWPPCRHAPLYEILRYACNNRDVVCFRAILEETVIERTQATKRLSTISNCDGLAIASNSLSILQEICRTTNKEIHTHYLAHMACLEGSIDIMAKRLDLDPHQLVHPWVPTHDLPSADALRSAAAQLRPENVKFLLERGARLKHHAFPAGPVVFWRYRRLHEEQFQAIRTLLRQYDCPEMIVFF